MRHPDLLHFIGYDCTPLNGAGYVCAGPRGGVTVRPEDELPLIRLGLIDDDSLAALNGAKTPTDLRKLAWEIEDAYRLADDGKWRR